MTDVAGPSPDWFRNTITQPVISPDDPQNRQRLVNGGIYDAEWTPSAGAAIRNYQTDGLGNLVRPWAGPANTSFTMGVRGLRGLGCGTALGLYFAPDRYRILGGVVAGAHGYARTKNVGWTIAWVAAGYMAPIFTGFVAIVQGLGKSKSAG